MENFIETFNSNPFLLILIDNSSGKILKLNRRALEFFQYQSSELIGKDCSSIIVGNRTKSYKKSECYSGYLTAVSKDKSIHNLLICNTLIETNSLLLVIQLLKTKKNWLREITYKITRNSLAKNSRTNPALINQQAQ